MIDAWVKKNRERYEAKGRSLLKEAAAQQVAEEYNFSPTGDPEMDLIIAMGLRDMQEEERESDESFVATLSASKSDQTVVSQGASGSGEKKKKKRTNKGKKKKN